MKALFRIFSFSCMLFVMGCAAEPSAWQTADTARQECHDRLDAGEFGTQAEMVAQCINPKVIAAYEAVNDPDLDLIMQINAKRLELAEEVDAKRITAGQASVTLAELATKMTDFARQRHLEVSSPVAHNPSDDDDEPTSQPLPGSGDSI